MGRMQIGIWLLTLSILAVVSAATTYTDDIEHWRQKREAALKADGGWLTLAGLVWLKEGANAVGSDAGSAIRLPRGPARVGIIDYQGKKATFRAEPNVDVKVNGKPATQLALKSDLAEATPDLISVGDFTFFVIHRGERDAIRLKDNKSEYRQAFAGLHWFPVKQDYRVLAKWVPYQTPKLLTVPNILGEVEHNPSPGYALFPLQGQQIRLDPVVEDGTLFFIFRDLTAGKETYPSGRFLHSEMPKNGTVILDFNEAYNPPCAFTPYATCPLPPKQNRLAIRIEAGELNYGHH